MQLGDLKKSPEEMTQEELQQSILDVRKDRRNFNRGPRAKKKKETIDIDVLEKFLEDL